MLSLARAAKASRFTSPRAIAVDAATKHNLKHTRRSPGGAHRQAPPRRFVLRHIPHLRSTRTHTRILHSTPLVFQDVPGLGRDGEVLAVKPGRARNHLVPGRMAAYATPDRLPEAAERRAAWAEESALTEQTDEDGGEAVRTDACGYFFSLTTDDVRERTTRTFDEGVFRVFRVYPRANVLVGRFRAFHSTTAKRTHAVMSDYYFGLEFLKAYPGVYTTVFPWLSERIRFSFRESRAGLLAREPPCTVTNDFANFLRLNASQRACSQR